MGGTHLAPTLGFRGDARSRGGPHLPAALPAENIYIQICPRVPCFCLKPARASVLTTWEARCDFVSRSSREPRVNGEPGWLTATHPARRSLARSALGPLHLLLASLQAASPQSVCSSLGSHGVTGSCHLPKRLFLPNVTSHLPVVMPTPGTDATLSAASRWVLRNVGEWF